MDFPFGKNVEVEHFKFIALAAKPMLDRRIESGFLFPHDFFRKIAGIEFF
jgi:hypothetical protein